MTEMLIGLLPFIITAIFCSIKGEYFKAMIMYILCHIAFNLSLIVIALEKWHEAQ